MVRCAGLATVTFGGGGAACFWPSPQPASRPAKAIAMAAKVGGDVGGMRSGSKIMRNGGYIWAAPSPRLAVARLWTPAALCPPAQRPPISWCEPQVYQSQVHLSLAHGAGHAGIAKGAPGTLHARPTHARCCQHASRPAR